jgi:hypothetical protein
MYIPYVFIHTHAIVFADCIRARLLRKGGDVTAANVIMAKALK